jgi:hypothetical protein
VVAHTGIAASSAFPRRAVTTLGIAHIGELESRGVPPNAGSGHLLQLRVLAERELPHSDTYASGAPGAIMSP